MMKNPSRKWSEVFILIIPPVIRMYNSKWEVVVVCRSRTQRGMIRRAILSQVIQLHFGEWGAAAVLV